MRKELKTTGDLKMEITTATCFSKDNKGQRQEPDEVGFIISGFSPKSDMDIEEVVTITKNEARRLIILLNNMLDVECEKYVSFDEYLALNSIEIEGKPYFFGMLDAICMERGIKPKQRGDGLGIEALYPAWIIDEVFATPIDRFKPV